MFGKKQKTSEQIQEQRKKELAEAHKTSYSKELYKICVEKVEEDTIYERSFQSLQALSKNHARILLTILNNQLNPRPESPTKIQLSSPEYLSMGGEAVVITAKDEITSDTVAIKFIKPYVIFAPGKKQKIIKQDKDGIWRPAKFAKIEGIPNEGIETENTLRFLFGAENQQKVHMQLKKDYGFSIGYCPKVLFVGKSPQLYLVQEYIEGVKLLDYVRLNNLTDEQRISLFLDILKVVEVIHEREIIHRDLTPDNILILRSGKPCVLDFSLSKDMSRKDQLTCIDTSFGKKAFASFHQLANTAKANYKDDIHTLAKVFYCVFHGDLPNKTPEHFSWDDAYNWESMPKKVQQICIDATERKYIEVSDFAKDISEQFPTQETIIVKEASGHTEIKEDLNKLKEGLEKTQKLIVGKIAKDKKNNRQEEFEMRIRILEQRFDSLEQRIDILEGINSKIYKTLTEEKRTK